MTYDEIIHAPINDTDSKKVDDLVKSMLENGWIGCPILIHSGELMTGSHRITALNKINKMYWNGEIEDVSNILMENGVPKVLLQDIAEDVTDIVEENYEKFERENGWARDIDFSDIGWLLEGSWVEEYKDEIMEW